MIIPYSNYKKVEFYNYSYRIFRFSTAGFLFQYIFHVIDTNFMGVVVALEY